MEMICQVIPIVALPRTARVFDYIVPESQQPLPVIGELVFVPFRARTVPAVVYKTVETSSSIGALKKIDHGTGYRMLDELGLELIMRSATTYGVSPSLILKRLLPAPLKNNPIIEASTATITATLPLSRDALVFCWQRTDAITALLNARTQDKKLGRTTLILSPDLTQARALLKILKDESPILLDTGATRKKFWTAWNSAQDGSKLIVGTTLLPFLPLRNVGTVFIDQDDNSAHKHPDINPRLDARAVMREYAERRGCELIRLMEGPRLANGHAPADYPVKAPIADLVISHAENIDPFTYLASVCDRIVQQTSGPLLVIVPGTGAGRRIVCRGCRWSPTCTQCQLPIVPESDMLARGHCPQCHTVWSPPLRCPRCNSTELRASGVTTSRVQNALADYHATVVNTHLLHPSLIEVPPATIILAYPEWSHHADDWRANERLAGIIARAIARARDFHCPIYIVSTIPEHAALRAAVTGDMRAFLEEEKKLRRLLHLPPTRRIIAISLPTPAERTAWFPNTLGAITKWTTDHHGSLSRTKHYRSSRHQRESGIILNLPNGTVLDTSLLTEIPNEWVIDIDPEAI